MDQTISFMTSAFSKATAPLGNRNQKGTLLYDLQVDFMWMLHEITMGPLHLHVKRIQEMNSFISEIDKKVKEHVGEEG